MEVFRKDGMVNIKVEPLVATFILRAIEAYTECHADKEGACGRQCVFSKVCNSFDDADDYEEFKDKTYLYDIDESSGDKVYGYPCSLLKEKLRNELQRYCPHCGQVLPDVYEGEKDPELDEEEEKS